MPSQRHLTILNRLKAGFSLFRRAIASDFIRKVAETFATKLALIGISLITSVIVARTLGPEGRGIYAVATAISAIGVQLGNLGLHASNTYYVARDRKLLPELVSNTLLASFGFGGIGSGLAWLVFFLWPSLAPIQGLILMLALLWIPFGLAYMLLQNLLLGIHEVKSYNKIELISKLLAVSIIGLMILVRGVQVEAIFSASLMALIISFCWVMLRLKPYLQRLPLPSLQLFKENIYYGLKAYVAAFFAFIVLRGDLFMIQYILGSEQAGYYSIAITLGDMIYMLPVVIGSLLFPKLSALSSRREKWNFTKRVAFGVSLIMLVTIILAALVAQPIVEILFGKTFFPAVPAFLGLMPGILMLSINVVYMNYFASTGMPMITVYSPAIAALANLVLNIKIIPLLGIIGASISSSICYSAMLGFSIFYIYNKDSYLMSTLKNQ